MLSPLHRLVDSNVYFVSVHVPASALYNTHTIQRVLSHVSMGSHACDTEGMAIGSPGTTYTVLAVYTNTHLIKLGRQKNA